jgi:putative FmdB family regulatory protein
VTTSSRRWVIGPEKAIGRRAQRRIQRVAYLYSALMPVYEYRCENGHQFEVIQRMSDPSITKCTVCGAPVRRVFHPIAVHFKGSGFYNTDYGKRGAKPATAGGESSSSDGGGGNGTGKDAKGESGSSKASEPAPT